jgi:hypothetical protein
MSTLPDMLDFIGGIPNKEMIEMKWLGKVPVLPEIRGVHEQFAAVEKV